jgi:hypothetical protein
MKLKFEVETHKDRYGNWVAQVLIDGHVVHEQTGPVSESQAISNVTTSVAGLLAGALNRQFEWETAD